jgi:hypothetical protein
MKRAMTFRFLALATAAIGCILVVAGCTAQASSSTQTLATFTGSGDDTTAHFTTSGSWVLAWTCDPYVNGASAPYALTIHDNTPDDFIIGTGVMDTQCAPGDAQGTVGVRQSGEQWLTVGTGGVNGPWTLKVQVPQGKQAALQPTPTLTPVTPPPPSTPLATPSTLPLTFKGSGSNAIGDDLFTSAVAWHLRATCTTGSGQAPYSIAVRVYQVLPSSASGFGVNTAVVGQDIGFSCDGQTADSGQSNPGGFLAGSYSIEVVTGGDWTVTVL